MSIRMTGLAALLATFLVGGSSEGAYTLTASGLNPTTVTFGGTSFTFTAITPGGQSGITPSNFNIIDVGAKSTTPITASDTGTVTLSENFALAGSSGTETFTLTGTFSLLFGSSGGIVSTYTGAISNIVGGGYTVAFSGYAQPSPGSAAGDFNDGKISLLVIPTAVPEPASIAMLGLGLVGVGGLAFRRKMVK